MMIAPIEAGMTLIYKRPDTLTPVPTHYLSLIHI